MMMNGLFQIDNEIDREDLGEGVQRKIYGYDEQVMMVKVKFETGAIGQLHQHPHVQVTYIESGVFDVSNGDKRQILKQGDGFYIVPDTIHGVVCLEAGVLIDTFAPHRSDFL